VFLPTVVYFFNSFFVEYTILEHYAVTLPVTLLVGLAVAAITIIPRAPRGLLVAACRFIVTYIVIAAVFLPSWDLPWTAASILQTASAAPRSNPTCCSACWRQVSSSCYGDDRLRRASSAMPCSSPQWCSRVRHDIGHEASEAIYSGRLYEGGSIRKLDADSYRDSVFLDAQRAGYSTALYGRHSFGCPAQTCIHRPLLLKGLAESILASYLGFFGLRSDAYITDLPASTHLSKRCRYAETVDDQPLYG
jgi:hypothetical protein